MILKFVVSGKHESGQSGHIMLNLRSQDGQPSHASIMVPRADVLGIEPSDTVTLTIAAVQQQEAPSDVA